MRVMAVDYGDVRTGIAVSDPTMTLAGEAWVREERSPSKLAGYILDEAKKRGAGIIVLGYPKNMDGTVGHRGEKTEKLAGRLREGGIEVILWDERRTTVAAHNILSEHNRRGKKRKKAVDAVAATLILDGYLRSQP